MSWAEYKEAAGVNIYYVNPDENDTEYFLFLHLPF